jgi:acetyl esterase/lipase
LQLTKLKCLNKLSPYPNKETDMSFTHTLAIALIVFAGLSAQAETITLKGGAPSTIAVLQPGISYTDINNGFSRSHLMLDLIKPLSAKPTPVIIFVSGNGWRSIDRAALVPQLAPFAKAGYLVASIDYRIIGEATFPEPLIDVKTAVRFLRANAKKYNLDPDKIGIWGNSAGGHLSAMAATTGDNKAFDNDKWPGVSSTVQAAVLWYAPTDLTSLPNDPSYVESAHIGADVRNPANLDKVRKADPVTYVSDKTAPTLFVHGTEDKVVPLAQSERLYNAMLAAKVPATLIKVEGAGHSFGQVSSVPEVMSAVLAFFDRYLKGK